ncbi:MAG: response regulator [Proteobacteria bacterium]|nr:response regulator [Pseudomonadota bacterium]
MHILLVEDDTGIAEPLVEGLQRQGYDVTWVRTGREAIGADPRDLVLLDLGLPDLDGELVAARIREHSQVPIIVVTARSDEIDRVTLLDLGADDYLVKPFGFRELSARIRALMRRVSDRANVGDQEIEIGPLLIDHRTRTVRLNGVDVALTPKEYDLLAFLASDPGAVLSRDEILRSVWDEHWWGSTKTLDVHIGSLRRKLGDADLILTVRGVGYCLVEQAS